MMPCLHIKEWVGLGQSLGCIYTIACLTQIQKRFFQLTCWFWYAVTDINWVSGKIWVLKFSLTFCCIENVWSSFVLTMCIRGWYLCIEFKTICKREKIIPDVIDNNLCQRKVPKSNRIEFYIILTQSKEILDRKARAVFRGVEDWPHLLMFRTPLNFDKWYSVQDINGLPPPPFISASPPFISKYALLPPIKQDPEYSPESRSVLTTYTVHMQHL